MKFVCKWCGKEEEREYVHPNTKWCDECRLMIKRDKAREYQRKYQRKIHKQRVVPNCNPPYDCPNCPYDDCINGKPITPEEAEFYRQAFGYEGVKK